MNKDKNILCTDIIRINDKINCKFSICKDGRIKYFFFFKAGSICNHYEYNYCSTRLVIGLNGVLKYDLKISGYLGNGSLSYTRQISESIKYTFSLKNKKSYKLLKQKCMENERKRLRSAAKRTALGIVKGSGLNTPYKHVEPIKTVLTRHPGKYNNVAKSSVGIILNGGAMK